MSASISGACGYSRNYRHDQLHNLSNDKEFLNAIWVSFYYAFGVCIAIWFVASGLPWPSTRPFVFARVT